MQKLLGFTLILVSLILIIAVVLSGCSSASSTTTNTATTSVPQTTTSQPTTSAPQTTTSQPTTSAPQTTTSKPTTSTPTTTTSSEPIKIGVISSISGFFSSMEPYMITASKMVADNINASGGLLGRQVELIVKDDMADPSQIPIVATALQSAGVVGVVGPFFDPCTSVMVQWAGDNKMLLSNTDSTTIYQRTTGFNKYTFFQCPVASCDGFVFAQNIAAQNDVNSVYYLGSDVQIVHDIYTSLWDQMAKIKPSVKNVGSVFVGATSRSI